MSRRAFIYVTPVLPWPADQGNKWFLLDSAKSLLEYGDVHWITREIGDQHDAIRQLTEMGFQLHLDRDFSKRDLLSRALRRWSIDRRARALRLPREVAFTCTPKVCRLVSELGAKYPQAQVVGAFWYAYKALEQVQRERRVLILSDVESARERAAFKFGKSSEARVEQLEDAEGAAIDSARLVLCLTGEDARLAKTVRQQCAPGIWPIRPPAWSTDEVGRPRPGAQLRLLLYGHWAADFNRDGLEWFLGSIWPGIRSSLGESVRVRIVGAGLTARLEKEARSLGLDARGYVEDLGAEFRATDAVLVPLRFAGGIRYRMLEALAAGLPCLASPIAAAGSDAIAGEHFLECDGVESWVTALRRISDPGFARSLGARGRDFLAERWGSAAHDRRLASAMSAISGTQGDSG